MPFPHYIQHDAMDCGSGWQKGGGNATCGCACYYRHVGGSSIDGNTHANRLGGGLWSPQYTKDFVIISLDGTERW